jgi:hypothetical protein
MEYTYSTPGHFPKRLLERLDDLLLHFGRRRAGQAGEYVDHGHRDLRLFLARRGDQTDRADKE